MILCDRVWRAVALGGTVLGLLTPISGCLEDASTAQATVDSRYVSTTEPADAVSIVNAVEKLQSEPMRLTLTGRIPGGATEPFEPNQASFLITELPPEGHGEDDPEHADNCPFCKRRAEQSPKAIVQIVGESGEVLPVDAREILGVQVGDRVVVEGEASFDSAVNLVTVRANRLYIDR